jgi:hypothetical protein
MSETETMRPQANTTGVIDVSHLDYRDISTTANDYGGRYEASQLDTQIGFGGMSGCTLCAMPGQRTPGRHDVERQKLSGTSSLSLVSSY